MFGADWWTADQQLFQDALARRTAPSRRRTATIRKRETTAAAGHEQCKTLLRRDKVTQATARAVHALYDGLSDQPLSPSTAAQARSYAAAMGWSPSLTWDDWAEDPFSIDDPGCGRAPGWRRTDQATWQAQDPAAYAEFILATQRRSRAVAARRIGSKNALDWALARARELEQRVG